MLIRLLSITLLVILIACNNNPSTQIENSRFNLDFEDNALNSDLPDNWFQWGTPDYVIEKDTGNVYSRKYSCAIYSSPEAKDKSFGCVAYKLPAHFEGRKISLRGYMKLENVSDGNAGLLLRIDGEEGLLEFENMQRKEINGTIDWKEYSITLPFHNNAQNIFIGGLLSGKGKVWFDKFRVLIDDVDIDLVKPSEKKVAKAELDTEFDKGSNIHIEELSKQQINNLHKLCKVWGFVKYHHPEIAEGNVNCDYELLRILPDILTTKDENKVLNNWIEKIGKLPAASQRSDFKSDNIKLKPNSNWISNQNYLGKDLSQTLVQIRDNKSFYTHYYIKIDPNVGKPVFEHEKAYKEMAFDDDGFKLLSLFRYWNMIQYYFPYRYLMDENWETVQKNFIPKMLEADNELSYKLVLLELIGKLQDTHANIWMDDPVLEKNWGKNMVPVKLKFIGTQLVVTEIYNEGTELAVGDIIMKIDGKAVGSIEKEMRKYCPASNLPTQRRNIARKILRTNKASLALNLQRGAKKLEKKVNCLELSAVNFNNKYLVSHKLLKGNIGYIYPGKLGKDEIDDIMKKFKNTRGLIVDFRCYPSDFIVFSLGKYLMPKPTEFVKFTSGSVQNPGLFTFGQPLTTGEENKDYYKNKVVIIVDETTQSSAEYTTMALRKAPKAIVLGSTTAGADGNVSSIILPGNIHTKISGIGVYYPNGKETQRIGIVPDVKMHPTIWGIRNGKDELLDKAIQLIKN